METQEAITYIKSPDVSAFTYRAVPEIILGGRRHFFVLWGGGCFVDNVSER